MTESLEQTTLTLSSLPKTDMKNEGSDWFEIRSGGSLVMQPVSITLLFLSLDTPVWSEFYSEYENIWTISSVVSFEK